LKRKSGRSGRDNHRYRPPFFLRNGQVQTVLASSAFRAWGPNPMRAAARQEIVAAGDGVRLLGARSVQDASPSKGLAILLHGWEGSSESTYVRCTGRALFASGYDVFRLNFRDHGASHHLNRGIFYAVRLDEVFGAVAGLAASAGERPVFLAGFSLGGNFALRISRRCTVQPIPNLRRVVAISPVLDPEASTLRVDRHPLIRRYFLKKWRRSLAIKQRLFPGFHDFGDVLGLDSIMAMTESLLRREAGYPSAREYFQAYGLRGTALSSLTVPTTLVTAADDPIIPVVDFKNLEVRPPAEIIVHRHGGHNGFLEGGGRSGFYETALGRIFDTTPCRA
jgi:hypothetical protein